MVLGHEEFYLSCKRLTVFLMKIFHTVVFNQ